MSRANAARSRGAGWTAVGVLTAAVVASASAAFAQTDSRTGLSLGRYEGIAHPAKEAELSAPFASRLLEVPVEEGAHVEAGALVARLDDRVRQREVEAARVRADQEAQIERAQAALEQAALRVQRLDRAFERDAASEWELDDARAQRRQAAAELAVAEHQQVEAEAQLALAEQELARYQIRAPFAGQVVRVDLDEGETLTAERTILTLAQLDPLRAELHLPVELYREVEIGRRYQLMAGEPVNETVVGRLSFISPVIDPASRTFRCIFTIPNDGESMLPAGFPVQLGELSPLPLEEAAEDDSASAPEAPRGG